MIRDIKEDYLINRIYMPQDILTSHNIVFDCHGNCDFKSDNFKSFNPNISMDNMETVITTRQEKMNANRTLVAVTQQTLAHFDLFKFSFFGVNEVFFVLGLICSGKESE